LKVTIFAIPKAMEGETARLQQNAFDSWRRLGSEVQTILLGDEVGLAQAAQQFGFQHIPTIQRNPLGTPLISDCFQQARQAASASLMVYLNADILLGNDFLDTIQQVRSLDTNRFLGIGQRWESNLEDSVLPWNDQKLEDWIVRQRTASTPASIVCKDYFIFPRHLYQAIPAFAVGRGNWDNWMVYHAHRSGIPVIDLSQEITAVHQPHGHSHCGNRRAAYVVGDEAKENQKLAGGRHLLIGSHASHQLGNAGQLTPMGSRIFSRAWRDAPRFIGLLRSLMNVR